MLQERLATVERSAAEKERQLERYAADLRETFKRERERRQELRRSYMATVRALCQRRRGARRLHRQARRARRRLRHGDRPRRSTRRSADDPEVEFGFLLHDVGKVAVPDAILCKPEPLTPEERTLMERHPLIGWEILREIDFLGEAKLVVRHHHERWDGAGYPDGLAGEAIPLAARVFAVADVARRADDRPPLPAAVAACRGARDMIAERSGTQFDPEVVDAFMQISLDAPRRHPTRDRLKCAAS